MRLRALFTSITIATILAFNAQAEVQAFSEAGFEQAQKNGSKIALHFHANWCPTCKKQKMILKDLSEDPSFQNIQFIEANYDQEKELRAKHSVKGQSTLIYFQGPKELFRSQGTTDKEKLKSEISTSLLVSGPAK